MPTGQAARKFAGDVTILSLGGTSILGIFKNASLTIDEDMEESRAAKDPWRYRVTKVGHWDVEVGIVVEDNAFAMMSLQGTSVAMIFKTSTVAGAVTYSGTVIVKMGKHNVPDEAQEITLSLEGQGALLLTVV